MRGGAEVSFDGWGPVPSSALGTFILTLINNADMGYLSPARDVRLNTQFSVDMCYVAFRSRANMQRLTACNDFVEPHFHVCKYCVTELEPPSPTRVHGEFESRGRPGCFSAHTTVQGLPQKTPFCISLTTYVAIRAIERATLVAHRWIQSRIPRRQYILEHLVITR